MTQIPDNDVTEETRRLLAELDQAIDHSGTLRGIVKRREQLHQLERLTGPSRHTRALRKEIRLLEQQLHDDRLDAGLASPAAIRSA